MTNTEMQKVWDRCLIKSWRLDGNLFNANNEFQHITKKNIWELDLLRIPNKGFPFKCSTRVFIANHLEKISNRLWNQPIERDDAMIEKLQCSKYTATKQNTQIGAYIDEVKRKSKIQSKLVGINVKRYSERNSNTDWNTVK